MKTSVSRLVSWAPLAIALVLSVVPDVACAAQGIGQLGQNMGQNVTGLSYMMRMIAYFIGFSSLVGGIVMFIFRERTNAKMSVILGMIVGGILLLSVMALASSGSSTVFGYDATTSAQSALGN